ncbi:MAG: hypothetical protein ABIM60_06105 [candidate division WOR-3 bacterium]
MRITYFLIIFAFLFSCEHKNEKNKKVELISYSYSDTCIQNNVSSVETAIVEIEIKDLIVKITHKNANLNCCPDSLILKLYNINDTIVLYEDDGIDEMGEGCDCTCEYLMKACIKVPHYGKYILEIKSSYFPFLIYRKEIEVPPPPG